MPILSHLSGLLLPASEFAAGGLRPGVRLRGRGVCCLQSAQADCQPKALLPRIHSLAAFGIIALALSGCRLPREEDTVRNAAQQEAKRAKSDLNQFGSVAVKGGMLTGQDDQGRPLWTVGAGKMETIGGMEAEQHSVRLADARATLYREGNPESRFTAKNMVLVYADNGATMALSGGVEAATSSPQTGGRGPVQLKTPQIDIDMSTRKLRAMHNVTMTQGGVKVTAPMLEADTGLHLAKLKGGVRASGQGSSLTADEADWNWETHRILARGHIRADHGPSSLTGEKLEADTNVEQGTLTQSVTARDPRGEARADSVDYDWRSGRLVARGGVTLTRPDALLTAARIETSSGKSDATASGGVVLQHGGATVRAAAVSTHDEGRRAVASGQVSFAQGDLHISAARAEAVGIGDDATLRVEASGGVRATTTAGAVGAERVSWNPRHIVADGDVTLSGDGNELSGNHLTAELQEGRSFVERFARAELTGDVHGTLKDGGRVRAGVLEWQGGRVLAKGGVSHERPDVRFGADEMDVSANRNVVVLNGHANASTPDGAVVRAPRVKYNRAAGLVFADGGVVYRDPQRQREIRGKTLKATLRNGKISRAVLTDIVGSIGIGALNNKQLFGN